MCKRRGGQCGKTLTIHRLGTTWDERYGELLLFKQEHGHCNVPQRYSESRTKFDPHTEKFVEYRIPTVGGTPRFIGVDNATGRVWFTESFGNKFGVLDPAATPTPSL